MRIMVVLALSALALAAAPACGGSGGAGEGAKGATAEEWSADVCGSLQQWKSDLDRRANDLQQAAAGTKSIAEARDLVVDFLDKTITRTGVMLREVEAAGAPAVADGAAIARSFREELGKIKPIFEAAREKAAALPDDPAAFAKGAQDIGTSMASAGGVVAGRLEATGEQFDAPELKKAFGEVPACQALQ